MITGINSEDRLVQRIKALRPTQPNRAYEILEPKFRRSPSGEIRGWGLRSFP
jgi:hypothetical protein